jgi:DNA-directed RNA polymerase subunit RPC12/RpoP
MSNTADFRTHVVRCSTCEELFGVAASTGKEIEKLSDPFEADCPHCGALSIFPKSAIEVLEAR